MEIKFLFLLKPFFENTSPFYWIFMCISLNSQPFPIKKKRKKEHHSFQFLRLAFIFWKLVSSTNESDITQFKNLSKKLQNYTEAKLSGIISTYFFKYYTNELSS